MFGPLDSQNGMPHLLELLKSEHEAHVRETKEKVDFYPFSLRYLTDNRPVESFAVDMNHGVRLSNNKRCVVSPGTNPGGTMQESGAVGISTGQSQPGQGGVVNGGGISIT